KKYCWISFANWATLLILSGCGIFCSIVFYQNIAIQNDFGGTTLGNKQAKAPEYIALAWIVILVLASTSYGFCMQTQCSLILPTCCLRCLFGTRDTSKLRNQE
ncbi:MAG: hypothetical protein MHPSP_003713, partial [Paramarteilia canceri]